MGEERIAAESARLTRELGDNICHLYADMDKARKYRLEKGEKLQAAVSAKLDEIRCAVTAEKRIRQESENTLLELFGQMGTKMQKELEATKQERAKTTDRLITLMEQVVPHLNALASSSQY